MEYGESPKSLIEVLDRLKNDLIERFPAHRDLIVSDAENAPKAIETLVGKGWSLDRICAYFKNLEKFYPKDIDQELLKEIRSIRIQIGDQIRLGKIALPEMKEPSENDQAHK